jgi:hypothetical protein
MHSQELPPIASLSAFEAWHWLKIQVSCALENPETAEECENLVGSLGPQYEEDPEAISSLLDKVDPKMGMDALLKENPGFELDDPPAELMVTVVSTLLSLRPEPPPEDEEMRRLKQLQNELNKPG